VSVFELALPIFVFDPSCHEESSLKSVCRALLDEFKSGALALGMASDRVQLALYPLVAWLDECVLRRLSVCRLAWLSEPLQMIYFQENTAGQGFFDRLDVLKQEGHEDSSVLQCYVYCLELGYEGIYCGDQSHTLSLIKSELGLQLNRHVPVHSAPRLRDWMDRLSSHQWVVVFLLVGLLSHQFIWC
jgi:type VI secretion system protein ImpK